MATPAPTVDEMIRALKKEAGIFEVHHVTRFRCFRATPSGSSQELEVEILDMGSDVEPMKRFACNVTADDGTEVTGNCGPSLAEVLPFVHWDELDIK